MPKAALCPIMPPINLQVSACELDKKNIMFQTLSYKQKRGFRF